MWTVSGRPSLKRGLHPSRLHGYGLNLALLQPISHRFQLGRGATEAPYWLAVSCGRHSHVVRFVADINHRSVGMDDFQTEIFALDFSQHLPPLPVVQFVPVVWCW